MSNAGLRCIWKRTFLHCNEWKWSDHGAQGAYVNSGESSCSGGGQPCQHHRIQTSSGLETALASTPPPGGVSKQKNKEQGLKVLVFKLTLCMQRSVAIRWQEKLPFSRKPWARPYKREHYFESWLSLWQEESWLRPRHASHKALVFSSI